MEKNTIDFEKITEILPEVIIVLDKELNIVWANKKAEETALEPPLNKKCYKVYMKRNTPCENCHSLKTFETGENIFNVSRVDYPDGSSKKFEGYTAVAAVDENNRPVFVAEIAREI
ncbi:MAG: PAS domain-containing protein [Desulfobacteraceae bacterium]